MKRTDPDFLGGEMPGPFPDAKCSCFSCEDWCDCGETEKALRAKVELTSEQREWALRQIDQVEGYQRADYEAADNAGLCRGVISAWTDYACDKGLL